MFRLLFIRIYADHKLRLSACQLVWYSALKGFFGIDGIAQWGLVDKSIDITSTQSHVLKNMPFGV
jgi:hypothetical protein